MNSISRRKFLDMAWEQPQLRASLLWVLPKASSLNLCPVRDQLDCDEHVQHRGSGRVLLRNQHQPVQPVGPIARWQVDGTQYRRASLRIWNGTLRTLIRSNAGVRLIFGIANQAKNGVGQLCVRTDLGGVHLTLKLATDYLFRSSSL